MEIKPLVKLENVSKYYKTQTGVSEGMRKVNLELYSNEFVAITGESGAGKTTLLNVLSGLDSYEDGELYINGLETSHFGVREWEDLRAKNIGFVFQNYNIIESYTVYQNVSIALEAQNYPKDKIKERSLELIEKVGLYSHRNQKTTKLSGGEKQRVVIARALAKDAPIILADEPTGNLDEKTSIEILKLLKELSKDKLVVLVTHDYNLAKTVSTRNIVMEDGSVKNDFKLEDVEYKDSKIFKEDDNLENKKFSKSLKIASRNIISTPKKTLFQLALSIITISAFLYLYSSIVVNNLSSMFNDKDQLQTVSVYKRDDSDITSSEITSLKNKNINISYDHSYYFDASFSSMDKFNIEANYYNVLNKNDLIKGRLPEKIREVVLFRSYYEDLYEIGSIITIENEDFEVVGITNKYGSVSRNLTIYFNPDYFFNQETLVVTSHGEKFFKETPKFDSLTVRGIDRREVTLFKNNIDAKKYQVVDLDTIYMKELEIVRATMSIFLWVVLLFIIQIIFLVSYNAQKNIMETKKQDFAVYRSIGINEQEVSLMVLFEQLMIAAISLITTIIIFQVLGLFFNSFKLVNRNINILSYLLIAVIFALFTIRQGLKFNKKIFNTTVIEALKEDI